MTHWILVDYENVQPRAFDPDRLPDARIVIFLGTDQKRLPADLVAALQPFGRAVEYVQVSGRGTDALDFHIAFFLGQLAVRHPNDDFHVISADRGFDPLLNHMRQHLQLSASRHGALPARLPGTPKGAGKPAAGKDLATDVHASLAAIAKRSRPRRVRTLRNWIASSVAACSDAELDAVVDELRRRRLVTVQDERVSYSF